MGSRLRTVHSGLGVCNCYAGMSRWCALNVMANVSKSVCVVIFSLHEGGSLLPRGVTDLGRYWWTQDLLSLQAPRLPEATPPFDLKLAKSAVAAVCTSWASSLSQLEQVVGSTIDVKHLPHRQYTTLSAWETLCS